MSEPSRRQKLKPVEYLAFAGAAGIFSALVTLLGTREIVLALIIGVVAFIGTLLGIATLMLAVKPKDIEKPQRPGSREGLGSSDEPDAKP